MFEGTIEDISNPFSPPESNDGEQSKKRPSSSVAQTSKRPCSSNSEEPPVYKKRDTPALKKRKQEDSQLSKLLENATKAISSINGKSEEDSDQYADVELFTRYLYIHIYEFFALKRRHVKSCRKHHNPSY